MNIINVFWNSYSEFCLILLAIKYSSVENSKQIEFYIDQMSNNEIHNYFYLENQHEHSTLYVKTKVSPLKLDKPEVNFMIGSRFSATMARLLGNAVRNEDNRFDDRHGQEFTRVNIKVMDSTGRSMSKQPSFKKPSVANYLITLNLTEANRLNSSLFELQATSPIGSIVSYRIVNNNSSPFHIENNMLQLSKEALYTKSWRNSYLVKKLFLYKLKCLFCQWFNKLDLFHKFIGSSFWDHF